MKNIEFSRELIKGRIAETIFEQMFRESGKFTILRSGFEYTLPELAQYANLAEVKAVMTNIRQAPDFVLISQDKKEVHLIEVKYRNHRYDEELKDIADRILEVWNPSWLFIASPDGFFLDPCNRIANNNGKIKTLLSQKWVDRETQEEYLKLLREFEMGH